MKSRSLALSCSLLTPMLSVFACGGTDELPPDPMASALEIIGEYDSQYGPESISKDTWSGAKVVGFDNGKNVAFTQNPADAMFGPNAYNRIVWTQPDDSGFFYCTEVFNQGSLDQARSSTITANASAPATGGCGSFPWTRLLKPLAVKGRWVSNFGGLETLTSTSWAGTPLVKFDNTRRLAFVRNPNDAQFNPGKFSRIAWTPVERNVFHYCYVDFGLGTLQAAETSTKTADASSPDTAGCGGFPWTKLSRN